MDGVALAAALVGLVAVIERAVVFLRALSLTNGLPAAAWPIIAWIIGVAFCVGWQINLAAQALVLVPALAAHAQHFAGVSGQVITGLVVGALAGPLHELVDALRGVANKSGT